MEQLELSHAAGGNAKWSTQRQRQFDCLLYKYTLATWPSNSTWRYLYKRNKNLSSKNNYKLTFKSILFIIAKILEIINTSLNWLQTVVHTFNAILFSNKKSLTTDTCKSWRNSKCNMLNEKAKPKDYTPADFIYVTFSERQQPLVGEQTNNCQGLEWKRGWLQRGMNDDEISVS